jgi:hypothetical protein
MTVKLSPRCRDKLIKFLELEGWLVPKTADLRQLAQVHGMLFNAAKLFPWAKCQFFLLQNLIHVNLLREYHKVKNLRRHHHLDDDIFKSLSKELEKRAVKLIARDVATPFIWRHQLKIAVPDEATTALRHIHDYLVEAQPWEMLIGHIAPRIPALFSGGDALLQGCGIVFPTLHIFCLMPVSPALAARFDLPHLKRILHWL